MAFTSEGVVLCLKTTFSDAANEAAKKLGEEKELKHKK